jgi:cytidyltransferase-like protein
MLNTIELQRFMQAEEIKDVAIVIGRWQFPHNGHIALFNVALLAAKKAIIVMGSAHQARNPRNPWTWSERRDMILAALPAEVHARVEFLPVRDYFDDELLRTTLISTNDPMVRLVEFGDLTRAFLGSASRVH